MCGRYALFANAQTIAAHFGVPPARNPTRPRAHLERRPLKRHPNHPSHPQQRRQNRRATPLGIRPPLG